MFKEIKNNLTLGNVLMQLTTLTDYIIIVGYNHVLIQLPKCLLVSSTGSELVSATPLKSLSKIKK